MKKFVLLCLIQSMLFCLSACSVAQPAQSGCGHEAYLDLIGYLEAGNYDEARLWIDAMEGTAVQPTEPNTAQPQLPASQAMPMPAETAPQMQIAEDAQVVELNQYNARDYFEFEDEYILGEQSSCIQHVVLKEEYRDRLLYAEDVHVEVTYLVTNAYGEIDMKAERFRSEYYDIVSGERKTETLELDRNHTARITNVVYSPRKGCFENFVTDVEIKSGSGRLFFAPV